MKPLFTMLLLSTTCLISQDNFSQYTKYPPCEQKFSATADQPAKLSPALQKYPPCEEKVSTPAQTGATENLTLQMEQIEDKLENMVAMLKKIEEIIKDRSTESASKKTENHTLQVPPDHKTFVNPDIFQWEGNVFFGGPKTKKN